MSQDICSLYDHLSNLVMHFETPSAVTFFRSTEAKQKPSRARDTVESGVRFANQIQEENLARVIFAAILLGGSTLIKFLNVVKEIDQNKSGTVTRKLKKLLHCELKFDEVYASWLSTNLHRLKESSVKLLEDLDPDSYKYVRLSTVTQFEYEKQIRSFQSRARNIFE